MDFLLPLAPQPLGVYLPRHWRDVHRSEPVEISQDGEEPLDLDAMKRHLHRDLDIADEDGWLTPVAIAARRQVEADLNRTLVLATVEMFADQFPLERVIPLPRPPAVEIVSFTYFDLQTGNELTVDPTTYFLDTSSAPARIVLQYGKVWPTSIRWQNGVRIRWQAGYADGNVPNRYLHAIKLLLAHWDQHREAVTPGDRRSDPLIYPAGYEALIGDRLVSVG